VAYSANEDIYDRLGKDTVRRLTDDDQTGVVDTQVLSRVRASVAREIDVYLRSRYDLPIDDAEAQEVMAALEADILAHRLYARRSSAEIPESVTELKDEAFDRLERIAKHGGLGLDQDGDGTNDGGSTLQVRSTDRETLSEKMDGRY
jgi:phage gp36-like protein